MNTEYKPSVSRMIGLLDKPALLLWANKQGLLGKKIDYIRDKSQKRGTSCHDEVEQWLLNKKPMTDEKQQADCAAFFADKEIMSVEKSIETEHFVGRLDLKFKHKGQVWICDMKTKKSKIYLENILQLVAYKMADGCDRMCVLSIPDFKVLQVNVLDSKPYEEIIVCLSKICKLKKQLGFE